MLSTSPCKSSTTILACGSRAADCSRMEATVKDFPNPCFPAARGMALEELVTVDVGAGFAIQGVGADLQRGCCIRLRRCAQDAHKVFERLFFNGEHRPVDLRQDEYGAREGVLAARRERDRVPTRLIDTPFSWGTPARSAGGWARAVSGVPPDAAKPFR